MKIVALTVILFVGLPIAPTSGREVSSSTIIKTFGRTACTKLYTQTEHARYARAVFKRNKVSKSAAKRIQIMRICQHSGKARVKAKRLTRRLRKAWKEHQAIRSITPYNCGSHGWFAVPCYIVQCESTFNPYADNGSHFGYYQCRYEYECGTRNIAAQHRGAAKLWDGGNGSSHWECA